MINNDIIRIKKVLATYFEADNNGDASIKFSDTYTSQEAIDAIYDIVGGFLNKEVEV